MRIGAFSILIDIVGVAHPLQVACIDDNSHVIVSPELFFFSRFQGFRETFAQVRYHAFAETKMEEH